MAERRPIVNPSALEEHASTDTLNVGQGPVFAEQASSLGTPTSGTGVVYAKTDGKLYFKNDGGTEYDLTATGGGGGTDPVIREYTASDTWNKPAGIYAALVVCVGAGGGGGSGRRGAVNTAAYGGNGAGGGAFVTRYIRSAQLGGSETITIGAGGTGAAAQTVDTTNGIAGAAGGDTSFGTLVIAKGGNGGKGGGTTLQGSDAGGSPIASTPARGPFAIVGATGGAGASGAGSGSSGQSGLTGSGSSLGAAAGGGGGGFSIANNLGSGGVGGSIFDNNVQRSGGNSGAFNAAGVAGDGGNAVNKADNILYDINNAVTNGVGAGGGGGGAGTGGGGNGGNGLYGSGAGGGGASRNGANSGAGGNGGDGVCYVVEFYGA